MSEAEAPATPSDFDEPLYRCLKKMECSSQGLMFDLPQEGSSAYAALRIDKSDAWKVGALLEYLIWFRDKAKSGANTVYMQGRGGTD